MKLRKVLLNLIMFLGIPITATIAMYFINFRLFPGTKFPSTEPQAHIALFFEGILSLVLGVLFFLGRGGISGNTIAAAFVSALAKTIFKDEDIDGPDETMKKDRWKPEGFPRLALMFIITGVLMLIVYFLTLK